MITREICKICHHVNPVGFSVPDNIWHLVVPEFAASSVVCIGCFTRLGDEKLIRWEDGIQFFPVSLASHLKSNRHQLFQAVQS